MRRRGRSLLLLRLRPRPPGGQRTRAGSQALQHRRRARVQRDLLGPPRVLPADEGHCRGLPHPRLRERPGPSAAVRSRLALAGGDREGLPNPGAPPSPRRRRRSPRVPQGPMGGRGVAALPAAGRVTVLHKIYRGAAASIARGPLTPRSLQETLQQLPTEVLRDLARAHRIDRGRQADRALLIETIMALPDGDAILVEADRRRMEHRLSRLRPRQLREIGERHQVSLLGLKNKADLVEALAGAPDAAEILIEVEAAPPTDHLAALLGRDSSLDFARVEELLVQARKRFQERRFEAALTAAQEASRIAERTTDQLRRASWSYAVLAAQGLLDPCDPADSEAVAARRLLERAREALVHGPPVDEKLLHDLVRRAERLAMKGQQRQIERAIQLRAAQVEKAQAILNACEPVLKEAESYDLSAAEVRTLLRQARDVLTKGDYLAGLTFARNAEEAARHLEAQIQEERRRRGIQKPRSGICGVCRSRRVTFQDDGWGRCAECGNSFRWRGPLGVLERLRDLLTP